MSQETRRFPGSVTARTLRMAQPGRSLLPVSPLAGREEILANAVATTGHPPRSPARASAGDAMSTILGFDTYDFRFPTSTDLDGSDAMNPSPDYPAAYAVIRTYAADPADSRAPLCGHGFAFTIGRGNDVQLEAIHALEPLVAGLGAEESLADLGALYRRLTGESALRSLGPAGRQAALAAARRAPAGKDRQPRRLHASRACPLLPGGQPELGLMVPGIVPVIH
jgi:hypothetical protein